MELSEGNIHPDPDGAARGRREIPGTERRCPPIKPSPRNDYNLTVPQQITEICTGLLKSPIMTYKHLDRNN